MLTSRLRQSASLLLLSTLLACSGGQNGMPASVPTPASTEVQAVRSAAVASIVFSGNLSQYTLNRTALTVTDNVTGAVRSVGATAKLSFADTTVSFDLDGFPGQAYRLYQAAFKRVPDLPGLGFQIHAMELNFTLDQIAQGFIDSPEFASTYGTLNDTEFVTTLYLNVLGRAPDADGLAFHVSHLQGTNPDGIKITRANDLRGFSESPENKALVLPAIGNGVQYTAFGTSPPSNPVGDFAASYNGSLSGGDSGVLVLTLAADGTVTATAHSTVGSVDLAGSGSVAVGGALTFTASATGRSLSFTGSVNLANGLATGTWLANNGDKGVFQAARVSTAPTFAQVHTIIIARCVPCHSVSPTLESTAPLGITFDTEAEIRSRISQINTFAVQSTVMPFGNATHMTTDERVLVGKWIAAGAP